MELTDKIKAIKADIETFEKELSSLEADQLKKNQAVSESSARRKELEEELQREQAKYAKLAGDARANAESINGKKALLQGKNTLLKETERELAIQELVAKQQEFWDALEARIIAKGNDLNSGLEGLGETVDPATAIQKIRGVVEAKLSFNETAVKIRNTIQGYQNCIEQLCSYKVDGRTITPDQKAQRIFLLDRLLEDRDIQPYWS